MQVHIPNHLFADLPLYDVSETPDELVVDLHNRPDLTDARGALHGGLIATLIDVAGGRLAHNIADLGSGVSTADMKVHYLEPIVIGPARAVATVVRRGSGMIIVTVDVFDLGVDRLAATSTLSFAVMQPRATA